MRMLIVFVLAGVVLAGCNKEKARKAAEESFKQATSAVAAEYEESKVVAYALEFVRAVESRDTGTLRRLCDEQGGGDAKAVLDCYYNAFAIENDQGVEATRKYLAEELAKQGNSPAQGKAVKMLNDYFAAKGSLRTKEIAAWVLIIGLECKYPKYGGKIGKLISEKLGLLGEPSATPPATKPA